ncbi:MAG: shikimate kinase [Alphaproteobacteria bacterium]|nr:shikimate kinase [Alphaproteobacteria bacterium]MBN2674992.1 shikimate kinase [Alphaproteobacteria bacterium]
MMNKNVEFSLNKPIVMVGLMGAGKTSIGRALSRQLGIPFIDSDKEIEAAAGCSVVDIFSLYGEEEFRRVEQRIISRLLDSGSTTLKVISTGEGAFITPEVRELVLDKALTIWLKADLELLVKRTNFRNTRPQLLNADSKSILSKLIEERYKIYSEADITVETRDESLQKTLSKVLSAIRDHIEKGVGVLKTQN